MDFSCHSSVIASQPGNELASAAVREKPTLPETYEGFLRQYSPDYTDNRTYYLVGEIKTGEWELFLSVVAFETPSLLDAILPYLYKEKISFRLIQNKELQYRLNCGEMGLENVGKVIILYPATRESAIMLCDWLLTIVSSYMGPVMSNSIRLGKIIFATYQSPYLQGETLAKRLFRLLTRNPFRRKTRRLIYRSKRVIGIHYRPRTMLRFSPKGEIHKAINMKTLSWCIIKRGRFGAFDDDYGRTIRDRLCWQAEVSNRIAGRVAVQKVIDYIEEEEDTYLILEYLEGEELATTIQQLNPQKIPWKELTNYKAQQILFLYQQTLELVAKLHREGIVHRDLTSSNIISVPGRGLHLIDFELSYDLFHQIPKPPFFPGASEFRPPEQGKLPLYNFKEDIFSVGCILSEFLTLWRPANFSKIPSEEIENRILWSTGDRMLADLVLQSTKADPDQRPELNDLIDAFKMATNKYFITSS